MIELHFILDKNGVDIFCIRSNAVPRINDVIEINGNRYKIINIKWIFDKGNNSVKLFCI